ncbi:hypothetical protein [Paeniglutamicibacter sp.]|uniref:hypothetical protein n=1 Tax=Paeniglutamicibacter sp. TaxID=1934391 RepID=UPI0039899533
MGNNHHEDERYKKFYDRPPHGEVPKDPRVKEAREGGTDPVADGAAASTEPDPSNR